jgi:hypothetical protein
MGENMTSTAAVYRFEQLHIDVARNSTDDFNPFHDPVRWQQIAGNPFGGPIALGFQLECLVADCIGQQRRASGEEGLIETLGLHFSNYEFLFAGALRAGEEFQIDLKRTLDKTSSGGGLSTRAVVRKIGGGLVLMGTQSNTAVPYFLADSDVSGLPRMDHLPDRSPVPGTQYFLKRKFMHNSNAKNFLLASLVDQRGYFDELAERVHFPAIFTASLLSNALLEMAWRAGYDFTADPLVYTSHHISLDKHLQRQLRSNDRLHLLVEGPLPGPRVRGLAGAAVAQIMHRCLGIVRDQGVLFRAEVRLAPLHAILDRC